jgi:hypothetical protein
MLPIDVVAPVVLAPPAPVAAEGPEKPQAQLSAPPPEQQSNAAKYLDQAGATRRAFNM